MARPSSVCAVVGGGARASAARACFRWACLTYVEAGEGLAALDYICGIIIEPISIRKSHLPLYIQVIRCLLYRDVSGEEREGREMYNGISISFIAGISCTVLLSNICLYFCILL